MDGGQDQVAALPLKTRVCPADCFSTTEILIASTQTLISQDKLNLLMCF
jgi:hypothetical protein